MSARSFRIFSGVLLGHLIVLNIVWVGFSVPRPRPPVTFIYEGELPAEDLGSGTEGGPLGRAGTGSGTSDQFAVDHLQEPYFNRWIELRDPSK